MVAVVSDIKLMGNQGDAIPRVTSPAARVGVGVLPKLGETAVAGDALIFD